jgi:hypothetical protein
LLGSDRETSNDTKILLDNMFVNKHAPMEELLKADVPLQLLSMLYSEEQLRLRE